MKKIVVELPVPDWANFLVAEEHNGNGEFRLVVLENEPQLMPCGDYFDPHLGHAEYLEISPSILWERRNDVSSLVALGEELEGACREDNE